MASKADPPAGGYPGSQETSGARFMIERRLLSATPVLQPLSAKFTRGTSPGDDVTVGQKLTFSRGVSPADSVSGNVALEIPRSNVLNRPQGLQSRDFSRRSDFEAWRANSEPSMPEVLSRRSNWVDEPGAFEGIVNMEGAEESYPSIGGLSLKRLIAEHGRSGQDPPAEKPALTVGVAQLADLSSFAAGSHNAVCGLRRLLDQYDGPSKLWGICHLSRGDEMDLDQEHCHGYLNQAGSDLLPAIALAKVNDSMVTKLMKLCDRLQLDGFVFICADGEMHLVAQIAEHFAKSSCRTGVVSILQSPSGRARLPKWLPASIGFDSACSAIAEVVGNIAMSTPWTTQDVYHFISCGPAAVTLEVAMRVHPTMCLISQDITASRRTLDTIIDEICDQIIHRHHEKKLHTGVILLSEGFYGALAQMHQLRDEIHRMKKEKPADVRTEEVAQKALPADLASFFSMLPAGMCSNLVLRTDVDGMPLLRSQELEEEEVGFLVQRRLAQRSADDQTTVPNLSCQAHNLRSMASCPTPTLLDCNMAYSLGYVAGRMLESKLHGYTASLNGLDKPATDWGAAALPMAALVRWCSQESQREDPLLKAWRQVRSRWLDKHSYLQPGPVQFIDCDAPAMSYALRAEYSDVEAAVQEEMKAEDDVLKVHSTHKGHIGSLLCPLQQQRLRYRPRVPKVLEDYFQIREVDHKGRVCSNADVIRVTFPHLWRTENLKPVTLQQVMEEANVLELLPERGSIHIPAEVNSFSSMISPHGARSSLRLEHRGFGLSASVQELARDRSLGTLSGGTPSSPLRGISGGSWGKIHTVRSNHKMGLRVAVMLVGRPCPGLNPLLQGLYEYVRGLTGSVLCISTGIAGLLEGDVLELSEAIISSYANQGGCHLLGNGDEELLHGGNLQFEQCATKAAELELDGLVVCGGRKAHTWTAELAEYFAEQDVLTTVIGVPTTASSDFPLMEQSLGYDTSCHTLAYLVANLAAHAASSRKQWFFVSITGESISQLVAEVASQTHPHVILTSESVETSNLGLPQITNLICDTIEARSKEDKNYGIVLLNGGLLASVGEMRQLMEEVLQIGQVAPALLDSAIGSVKYDFTQVLHLLSPISRSFFQNFPGRVKRQICSAVARMLDQGGNKVSLKELHCIDTEQIFKALVENELTRRVVLGTYKGPFQCNTYSMAYHSEAAMPTSFDCDLGYTSGRTAAVLVEGRRSGYLVDITRLKEPVEMWSVGGTPLSSFLSIPADKDLDDEDEVALPDPEKSKDIRLGFKQPAGGRAFIPPRSRLLYDVKFERSMPNGESRTLINPGPVQYTGPCAELKTHTLIMPSMQRVKQMAQAEQHIKELKTQACAGCPEEVLTEIRMLLRGGVELLKQL